MSLRRDVHTAFDSITPPAAGMAERVVQTVLAEHTARRRKERMLFRLRAPLSLVAVLVLIALVVGALIGGRLISDWNSSHSSIPAGQPQLTVADLEARPIILPTIGPNDPCPVKTGTNSFGLAYGSGPVYADGGNGRNTSWGTYWDIYWYSAPSLRGPVLIRGRDLRSSTERVVFIRNYVADVAGPVVGNDPSPGTGDQYAEITFNASDPSHRIHNALSPWNGFGSWLVRQGLSNNASDCVGFQIDGSGFTETFWGPK